MSLPVAAHPVIENAEAREPPRRGSQAEPLLVNAPTDKPDAITLELNFNAFADHVPPTQHARREANPNDPSIQDFADQALEIATLRAELKRLTRDYEALQNAMHWRDKRLQALQDELAIARKGLRDTTQQLSHAQSPSTSTGSKMDSELPLASPVAASGAMTGFSESETPETPTLELPKLSQPVPDASMPEASTAARRLIPLDHPGQVVALTRDIMTIGRTRANDICIPSHGVSRDHARLLVAPRSVTLVNVSSANGCFVNDQPISKQRLRNGDLLRLGDRCYRFVEGSG